MKPFFVKAFLLFQPLLIILIFLSFFLHGTADAQRLHASDLVYRGAFDRDRGIVYFTEQTAGPSDETVVHVFQVAVPQPPGVLYVSRTDTTCGGNNPCYASIQAALVAATTGAHIRITGGNYHETPLLDRSKTVTLSGGWNAAFNTRTANFTRITSLRVKLGTLHVQEMCIGQ